MALATGELVGVVGLGVASFGLSFALNRWLMPVYGRYALARPNARSSHTTPTPQGGGVGVLAAMVLGLAAYAGLLPGGGLATPACAALAVAVLLLAATGWLDDIYELPVLPRLVSQVAAAALGLYAAVGIAGFSAGPAVGLLAAPLLVAGLVWAINLTNFMDGIDGITVAEFVPMAGAFALLASVGAVPAASGLIGAALLGGLAGFAPYNRHKARLFLGDVGSLPIGLIGGVLLLALALAGHVVAAAILPLYYVADATLTLLRRLANGENITQAHRSHFYQRATVAGWRVPQVTARLWLLNGGLVLLALASIGWPAWWLEALCFAVAAGLVARTLSDFTGGPSA